MGMAKGQVSEMGFTIVEMLVTIAIIAIIIAIVIFFIV
jgi:prepilin-type N-terminal cleavage/methylation domain-containing protein